MKVVVSTELFTEQDVNNALLTRRVDNDVLYVLGLAGTRRELTAPELHSALWDIVDGDMPIDFVDELTGEPVPHYDDKRQLRFVELEQQYAAGQTVLGRGHFVVTERYTTNTQGDVLCKQVGAIDSPWVQVPAGYIATTQAYRCIALKAN